MLREIKIYWALRPTINKLQEVMKMKFSTNMVLQTIAILIQGANQVSTFLPEKSKFWVALGTGALQLIAAGVGHVSNPDGTDVKTPYVPPAK